MKSYNYKTASNNNINQIINSIHSQLSDFNLQFDYKTKSKLSDPIPFSYFTDADEAILSRNLNSHYKIINGNSIWKEYKDLNDDENWVYLEPFELLNGGTSVWKRRNYGFIRLASGDNGDEKRKNTLINDSNESGKMRMIKVEWNKRMNEYQTLRNSIITNHKVTSGSTYYNTLQDSISLDLIQTGSVLYFTGVNPTCTIKTLKNIFNLIAPVHFIDKRGHDGYIFYKTSKGAQLALEYFNRIHIYQSSDVCTGIIDSFCINHHDKVKKGLDNGICVYELSASEQEEYWNEIQSARQDCSLVESNHFVFDNESCSSRLQGRCDEVETINLQGLKHVIFNENGDTINHKETNKFNLKQMDEIKERKPRKRRRI